MTTAFGEQRYSLQPTRFASARDSLQSLQQEAAASRQYPVSDQFLLEKICSGSEWALEELYRRYARYAFSLALYSLRDSGLAEDIVQEVFLSVWRKADSYQSQHGDVRSWLLAMVRHRSIDRHRSMARHDLQAVLLGPEQELDVPDESPEAWEELWQHELGMLIHNVLAQLPEEQRQVIELSYFGGYSHRQLARHLHLPLGTVKARMRLGLQKMKSQLARYGIHTFK